MTKRCTTLLALVLGISLLPQPARAAESSATNDQMTTYYMGLIYRGEKWTPERTPEVMELQKQHLANIERLAGTGELLLAGPMLDDGELRGIFVFQVESLERARELVETDPAVKSGRLKVELHPWYAVKGITYPKPSETK